MIEVGEELLRDLDCEFGRPLTLEAVLEDAVRSGKLIELKDFLARKESLYRKRWVPTVGEVVGWGLRQLGLKGSANFVKDGFVVLANVEVSAIPLRLYEEKRWAKRTRHRLRRRWCWNKSTELQLHRARGFSLENSSRLLSHLLLVQNG